MFFYNVHLHLVIGTFPSRRRTLGRSRGSRPARPPAWGDCRSPSSSASRRRRKIPLHLISAILTRGLRLRLAEIFPSPIFPSNIFLRQIFVRQIFPIQIFPDKIFPIQIFPIERCGRATRIRALRAGTSPISGIPADGNSS